ncbi:MAG: hypothetical protein HYX36_16900 [Rhizobiales bacterium]|nr:hypothetical protein [Hyphomicrobiales bacterium]
MLKRFATLAVLGLALAGCILQSKTPVIPADGGKLLLRTMAAASPANR